MQLLGRSGAALIPLLNDGSAGLEKMREEAERTGQVISGNTAAAAERFNDNLTRLGGLVRGSANALMEWMVPALEGYTNKILEMLNLTDDAWKKHLVTQRTAFENQRTIFEASTISKGDWDKHLSWIPGYVTKEEAEYGVRMMDARIKLINQTLADAQWESLPPLAASMVGEIRPLNINLPDDASKKAAEKALREHEQLLKKREQLQVQANQKLLEMGGADYAVPDEKQTLAMETRTAEAKMKLDKEILDNHLKVYQQMGEDEEKAWNTSLKLGKRSVYEYKRINEGLFDGMKWGWHDVIEYQNSQFEIGIRTVEDFAATSQHTVKNVLFDAMTGDLQTFGDYWNAFWTGMKASFAQSLADMAVSWGMSEIGELLAGKSDWLAEGADWLGTAFDVWHSGLWKQGDEALGVIQQGEMVIPKNIADMLRQRYASFEDFSKAYGMEGSAPGKGGNLSGAAVLGLAGKGLGFALTGGLLSLADMAVIAATEGRANSLISWLAMEAFGQYGWFGPGPNSTDPGAWSTAGDFGTGGWSTGGGLASGGYSGIGAGEGGHGGGIWGYEKGTGLSGLPQTGPFYGHAGEIILNPRESEFARRIDPEAIAEAVSRRLGGSGGSAQPLVVNIHLDGKLWFKQVYEASRRGEIRIHPRAVEGYASKAGLNT
jgi:hypothetical protein